MLNIQFPDGNSREYPDGSTPLDIASSISNSLAKRVLLARINGDLWDITRPLEEDSQIELLDKSSAEGMELLRHDCAHIMAQAVQDLFPDTQVTIGPVIDNGFYYDFARETPFSTGDFDKIEARMREIVDADYPIERQVWNRQDAIAHFRDIGEIYKAEIIEDLPENEPITIYQQGEWKDLCRGPHLPSTGKLGKAFKLMKLAGAYWRGDHRNAMLQRIYGTAWADEKQLKAHLTQLEEAEKRDHRRLGQQMGLFHLQPEAQGSVFWHPKGYRVWLQVEAYIRRRLAKAGYNEVKTPQLLDRKFWELSGHWDKFRDNMFVVPDEIPSLEEEVKISPDAKLMALKPMNCPAHVQVFNQYQRSYRDLPLRLAEFGCCHRNEAHGALHGLMRVRQMTQDDAHIFCREDQIESETVAFCELLASVYRDFGFEQLDVKLALRPDTRAGDDTIWDQAEGDLEAALKKTGLEYESLPGEGAFYGPKLEFHLTDAIGRTWQCGTLQLDFVLPERLDAAYIGEDGESYRPVMLHRAILGTLERFLGILIEDCAGAFPLWLAPVQVMICTITSDADSYAKEAAEALAAAGMRIEVDLRNEKINYKVREHSVQKVPIIAVIGRNEAAEKTLTLRRFGTQKTQESIHLDEACTQLAKEGLPPDLARG